VGSSEDSSLPAGFIKHTSSELTALAVKVCLCSFQRPDSVSELSTGGSFCFPMKLLRRSLGSHKARKYNVIIVSFYTMVGRRFSSLPNSEQLRGPISRSKANYLSFRMCGASASCPFISFLSLIILKFSIR
jgi:hypothetical protein